MEIEPYRHFKEKDYFSEPEKRLIQTWAEGIVEYGKSAQHLKLSINTIKSATEEIYGKIYANPGIDRKIRAIVIAGQKGCLDESKFTQTSTRKLKDSQLQVLAFRLKGLNREKIAIQLNKPKKEVAQTMQDINSLIGVDNDYSAIAWAVVKVSKRKQSQEKDQ